MLNIDINKTHPQDTVSLLEGYEIYKGLVDEPLSWSWFRDHSGDPEDDNVLFHAAPVNPGDTKKKWAVTLVSIEEYVDSNPTHQPRPRSSSCKIENSYEKFREHIPDTVTEEQYLAVVRTGVIRTRGKDGDWITGKDIKKFFQELRNLKRGFVSGPVGVVFFGMQLGRTYDYSTFAHRVKDGQFNTPRVQAYKEGWFWHIPVKGLLNFLRKYPDGTLTSGPKRSTKKKKKTRKSTPTRQKEPVVVSPEPISEKEPTTVNPAPVAPSEAPTKIHEPLRVKLSLDDYEDMASFKKARQSLREQGFKVDIL